MDVGLVVVLAVLGAFLLVSLAFAWVSTNPRRWARVEGVLGRDLPTGHNRIPRWLPVLAVGVGVLYLILGVYGLLVEQPARRMVPFWFLQGVICLAMGLGQYHDLRRNRP
jgi:hypothetical protein